MDLQPLEEAGLSHAEARVYTTLLELGPSKTGAIIDSTKLQSSTVYHVLGSLLEKGLISYIHEGKIKTYHAESPEVVLTFLEEKKKKLKEILPELKEKQLITKTKPKAKVFYGVNGIRALFNDLLDTMKKGETYLFLQMSKTALQKKEIALFFRNYHLKRAEKGIKVRGIALKDVHNIVKNIFEGIKNSNIRYLNESTPTGVVIYKTKTAIIDWEQDKPLAVLIESQGISKSYTEYFEEKWKIAKA